MKLIERIRQIIRAWFRIGGALGREPGLFLPPGMEALEPALTEIKTWAIIAMAHRNHLRGLLHDERRRAAKLEAEVRRAVKRGAEELARGFRLEREKTALAIVGLEIQLERAEQEVQAIRDREVRRLEDEIRQRVAEGMRFVAGGRASPKPWSGMPGWGLQDRDVPPPWALLVVLMSLFLVVVWLLGSSS